MICKQCGRDNPNNNQFCGKCAEPLGLFAAKISAQKEPPAIDRLAVASLICGILSWLFSPLMAGLPAIALGHYSRSRITDSKGELRGKRIALGGLILSYVSITILFLSAWERAYISKNESSAVSSLRVINNAVLAFRVANSGEFPKELRQMGSRTSGLNDGNRIDEELASGQKTGYHFVYEGIDSNGDQVFDGYTLEAIPLDPGFSGKRSFCSDQTGEIHMAIVGEKCTAKGPLM